MATEAALHKPIQIDFPGFEIEADDTVVDVGCGDGPVCVYAGARGADVIGIDIEPLLVDRCAEAMKAVNARSFRGIVSDANPIPLPDGTASVVIATEVLEHVDDPSAFAAELFRIGRPGARYLISVPDPASESIMKDLAPAWYFQKPIHIRVFEHDELDRCCREGGLEVVSRHSAGFPQSMYWMLRMAVGMEHKYADCPDHPAFGQLDGVLRTVLAATAGRDALRTLDRLIPKSQVVVARKPVSAREGGRTWSPHKPSGSGRSHVGQFLRDGSLALGGIHLSWKFRRAAR